MPQIKAINHVAVVVEDMEQSLAFWRDALGIELHELRDVPAEKSQVAFLPLAGAEVELVMPTTDDSGIAKYAICHHEGSEHTHDDHHVHFKCLKCERIECLHNLEIPKLQLPRKYKMENANLLIEGICGICNN